MPKMKTDYIMNHKVDQKMIDALINGHEKAKIVAERIQSANIKGFVPMLVDMNICGDRLAFAYNICRRNLNMLYYCAYFEKSDFIHAINHASAIKNKNDRAIKTGALDINLGNFVDLAERNALQGDKLKMTNRAKEKFQRLTFKPTLSHKTLIEAQLFDEKVKQNPAYASISHSPLSYNPDSSK